MSYSRTYHETVSGSKTVTVHYTYPASQNGGSSSETVTVDIDIPVTIDIDVDTNPFDRSISTANNHVSLLTGSVVATEAAHIAAKVQSSEDISNSIVDGFFGLIKSEINQQLTEIRPRVDALIIELMQHQQTCAQKKVQLEGDFGRISERYAKIFFDLDKELRNRILLLNQSAVGVHGTLTTRVHRSFTDISSGIATIYNKEGSHLQSMLYATNLKIRALSLIDRAKNYLFSEKNLSAQLQQILIPVEIGTIVTRQVPVLYFERKNPLNGSDVSIISSEEIPALADCRTKLTDSFANSAGKWLALDSKKRDTINTFLKLELSSQESQKGAGNPRVAEQIMHLWSNNTSIQTNN
jgi:hypothetical protein